ncbi:MAG TPA: glycoside hydrolase family 172 protein [Terriglobales bacterium]|nr:glycoside hydrolase family 172 protein [Terriglobales bacterium]
MFQRIQKCGVKWYVACASSWIVIALALSATLLHAQEGSETDIAPSLGSLANLTKTSESRMVSPENPTGGKGQGAMAIPSPSIPFSAAAANLGQGWKVRPFIKIAPHSMVTIMDVSGPGTIEHIWMASSPNFSSNGRATVLRFYWDGEETPSVEVPLTDFFAIGNDRFAPVNSLAVIDVPAASMNCYWPMPFRKHAKVTVTNDSDKELPLFTYQIDYRLSAVPADAAYFHAQWRRATVNPSDPVYTILDAVKGEGRYVGTFLAWTQLSSGWFGEGEVKFYLDGDSKFPTIVGTGTEDYFGADYGFPALYSTAYVGNVLNPKSNSPDGGPPQHSLYRWHIMDPISFHKDLKVTIQDLGWFPNGVYQPEGDDIASVAYWYQMEPHTPFPPFPPLSKRWPR